MKTVFLALILTLVFGAALPARAQKSQTVKVRVGQQKSIPAKGLTIKFLSLVEDSRCPTDTNCVWAGNAKIKVQVSNRQGSQTFEMNTNLGPKGDSFGGYAINLVNLAPVPRSNVRINRNSYTATFTVSRLTR